MPQQARTAKQERQYEHVKKQAEERGVSTGRAEEIAARTMNKERSSGAQRRHRGKAATGAIPTQRRGSTSSRGRTKDQLYADAQRKKIKGRSKMTKRELEKALGRH